VWGEWINRDQRTAYAPRKAMTIAEAERWFSHNLNHNRA
jgi:hypothetical protein